MNRLTTTVVLSILGIILSFGFRGDSTVSRRPIPRIVLWAWERPEDLSFIDPNSVGVAFLAQSIQLTGDKTDVYPRRQSLAVPKGTTLIAVVRISTSHRSAPTLSGVQLSAMVDRVLKAGRMPGIRGLQIDFDATVSERPFYRSLLDSLRRRLPDSLSLSITALASWCLGDAWIADLPLDDAVPMLFRMGPDRQDVLDRLNKGQDFSVAICRNSVGLSTDEPFPTPTRGRRVFIFSPKPWTRESFETVLKEINK